MGSTRGRGTDGPAARPAVRLGRARIADVRLWGGVALLGASVVAGTLLLGQAEPTVTAWRAVRDLSAGSEPSVAGGDVEPVEVSATIGGDVYADAPPDGSRLRWPVAAGELVPRSALAAPGAADTRLVTVPVDPVHAPVGLLAGDVVDAWSTPRPEAGTALDTAPDLVLPAARVADVSADALGLGGELAVVLEVPAELAARVVAAARSGVIDLVAVPVTSQEPNP